MSESLKERVARRLDELELGAITAATSVGLERTYIRDIVTGKKKSVSTEKLPVLAQALRTTVEYLTFRTDNPEPRGGRLRVVSRPTVTESTVEDLSSGDAFNFAKVDGSVQAGAFLAVEAFDDDLGEVISAPRDPLFPFARQVAHRVKGDSMNQAEPQPMRDGDYIICAAWEDLGLKEKTGLNVVVQQTTADGQLRERSVKELRVFPDHVEFHPRSSNPVHKPIIVNRDYHTDDGKEVTILSLVRFVFNNQALPV